MPAARPSGRLGYPGRRAPHGSAKVPAPRRGVKMEDEMRDEDDIVRRLQDDALEG